MTGYRVWSCGSPGPRMRALAAVNSPSVNCPAAYRFYDTDPIVYTCVGCGYDTNSCGEHEPRTEDINDCPELRDIAAIYADHEDYAPKWSATP